MARKLRIAVLYNEPVAGGEQERTYVGENGRLLAGSAGSASVPKARTTVLSPSQDLSELGVVDEMEDIKSALTSLGYKTSIFNVDGDVFRLFDHLRNEQPDLIFNLVECVENESLQEMNVAGVYDLLKIPYTGASALTLGMALNKPLVKQILTYHGILTPKFQVFHLTDKVSLAPGLDFPLIVKPSREDASVGIADASVVNTLSELRKRVRYIHEEFDQPALVEEFVEGREFNVAIIGNKKPVVLPISEIDFSGLDDDMPKIVSYAAKWMHGTVEFEGTKGVCPAKLPAAMESKLREIALRCYGIIGCRDYARVDFRVKADGTPYVLEVNPNPDISDDAGFARSARVSGYTFPQIVGKIVEYALDRCH